MLHGGQFNERFRLPLRAKAKTTSNKLRNIYVTTKDQPSAFTNFHQIQTKLLPEHWREYGRVGYVTERKTIKRKDAQRGNPMLMVGYADDHPALNCMIFLRLITNFLITILMPPEENKNGITVQRWAACRTRKR
jgi:hypothetical protein